VQLGTRWPVGGDLPGGLPEVVGIAVTTVEDDLGAAGADTTNWRWTLTWLERSPVLELDDGTVIRYDARADEARIVLPAEQLPDEFDED
jgi:hypothetical protein